MKFSLKWLSKYTNIELNERELFDLINKIAYQIVDVEEFYERDGDLIIDVDNKIITNRAYCFGHRGLSREIAILLNQNWLGDLNNIPLINSSDSSRSKLDLEVHVQNPKLCSRFLAVVIKGIKIKESPVWLKNALESVGQRPINNLVDITNYIMLDTGHPVHAYDYNKVKNKQVIVRNAYPNEIITTLDGIKRVLDEDILVIADAQGPIAIAGIMGGANSEIDQNTTDIILEVASFHPINIRKASRKINLRTEAVTRFEKGPDILELDSVMHLLIQMVLEICGGEIASEIFDIKELSESYLRTKPLTITLDLNRVEKILGFAIEKSFIRGVFDGFGIEIQKEEGSIYTLSVPTYRNDIKEDIDLIEDIGRMYGYDKIPSRKIFNELSIPQENIRLKVIKKIIQALTATGLDEAITYSFISENDVKNINKTAIKIINPISKEYSYLRPSLMPSFAKLINTNSKNFDEFGFFEISKIFKENNHTNVNINDYHELKNKNYDLLRPIEEEMIAGCYYKKGDLHYATFKLKAAIENIFKVLKISNYRINFEGQIYIDKTLIGYISNLPLKLREAYDLENDSAFFECHLTPLIENFKELAKYQEINKYPGSRIKFSLWAENNISVENIINSIFKHEWIKSIEIEEVYRNNKENRKSILLSLYLQNPNGNITSNEIYDLGKLVEKSLNSIKGVQVRGEMQKPTNYKPSSILCLSETSGTNTKVPYQILVGKIIKIYKHPNADKLFICHVDIGKSEPDGNTKHLQIITGASNIRPNQSEGLFVPVAIKGSVVFSSDGKPIKIKHSKLKGEMSYGMLCSAQELGIKSNYMNDEIMILEDKTDENIGDLIF